MRAPSIRATPILPFLISCHSSISLESLLKIITAMETPIKIPIEATIAQPIALRYSIHCGFKSSPIINYSLIYWLSSYIEL
jgi:hypothetical protein